MFVICIYTKMIRCFESCFSRHILTWPPNRLDVVLNIWQFAESRMQIQEDHDWFFVNWSSRCCFDTIRQRRCRYVRSKTFHLWIRSQSISALKVAKHSNGCKQTGADVQKNISKSFYFIATTNIFWNIVCFDCLFFCCSCCGHGMVCSFFLAVALPSKHIIANPHGLWFCTCQNLTPVYSVGGQIRLNM